MANVLSTDKQAAIIGALAEGSSIRSIERQMGVHRDTIMRLGVRVGKGCAALLDAKMRDSKLGHVQFDEIWGFIGKKEKHVQPEDNPTLGDVWTFCALDSETKLVPAFRVGKRNRETTRAFVQDVASRLRNRVQLSTDAMSAYVEAVELAFGPDVDYAQVVKVFESNTPDAEVIRVDKTAYAGRPDMSLASTSHVESVPVKETFQGKTVWEGVVEVFVLIEHPNAPRVYAWAHDTDNPKKPRRHVTVLHLGPVTSPILAVRAAIVQEFRNAEAES